MIPEERAKEFRHLEDGNYAYDRDDLVGPEGEITKAIRAAIEEEREACAKLCDSYGSGDAHDAALRIRARAV